MNFKGFLVSGMHFYGKQNLVPFNLHNSYFYILSNLILNLVLRFSCA